MKELEMFVTYMKTTGKSENTLKAFPSHIKEFFDLVGVSQLSELESLTVADYNKYLKDLADKGNGANTRNAKLSAVNSFCEYLVKMDLLIKNTTKKIDRAKIPKKVSIQPTK
jgi:site-specific recombinase XerD